MVIDIAKISFDYGKPSLEIVLNAYFVVIALLGTIVYFVWRKRHLKALPVKLVPVSVTIGSKNTIKYSVERNDKNVEVAYRIYIELVTRKAAIQIDPEKDVIVEVYNSWYKLFVIVREEIKTLPGLFLQDGLGNNSLVEFTLDILNNGLRPHLTEYQADFRRWYEIAKEDQNNKLIAPQELQKYYPRYKELIADMKHVNQVLIDYAGQLMKLIDGDK